MKRLSLLCLLFALILGACHKNAEKKAVLPPVVPGPPGIDSIGLDYCSGSVTIIGADFDSIPAKDTILLSNDTLIPLTATSTRLTFMLPAAGYAGKLAVRCSDFTAYYYDSVIWEKPVIDSISPSLAGTGTIVTVFGRYFDRNAAHDSVYFNQIAAPIVATGPGYIQTVVPSGSTTGTITVHTYCRQASALKPFVLSNRGTIYLTANDALVHAFDVASGGVKWTAPINGSGLAYANGVIYTGGIQDNSFYALSTTGGSQLWKISLGSAVDAPAIVGDTLFVASQDYNIYALDTTGRKLWSFNTGYGCTTIPLISNGIVYECNQAGYLYAVNTSTGSLLWRKYCWGRSPAYGNGMIFTDGFDAAGEQPLVYALNAATGDTIWTYNLQEGEPGPCTYYNGMVITTCSNQPIRALDASTGRLIWASTSIYAVGSSMEISNNTLYLTSGALICALNPSSGVRIWSAQLDPDANAQGSPTVANGVVYVGSWDGGVYAFDAISGHPVWKTTAGGYPVLSGPVVVDSSGNVFYAGGQTNQP